MKKDLIKLAIVSVAAGICVTGCSKGESSCGGEKKGKKQEENSSCAGEKKGGCGCQSSENSLEMKSKREQASSKVAQSDVIGN